MKKILFILFVVIFFVSCSEKVKAPQNDIHLDDFRLRDIQVSIAKTKGELTDYGAGLLMIGYKGAYQEYDVRLKYINEKNRTREKYGVLVKNVDTLTARNGILLLSDKPATEEDKKSILEFDGLLLRIDSLDNQTGYTKN